MLLFGVRAPHARPHVKLPVTRKGLARFVQAPSPASHFPSCNHWLSPGGWVLHLKSLSSHYPSHPASNRTHSLETLLPLTTTSFPSPRGHWDPLDDHPHHLESGAAASGKPETTATSRGRGRERAPRESHGDSQGHLAMPSEQSALSNCASKDTAEMAGSATVGASRELLVSRSAPVSRTVFLRQCGW